MSNVQTQFSVSSSPSISTVILPYRANNVLEVKDLLLRVQVKKIWKNKN